ncbi:MAG TPA: penicillin-binding transpeptidase domain-containing protein [Acidimicrobiales bacterium]|nr:penicillin-binding transpeptidase domain-containing protein [Acidimicrobiales bacterium]
MSAAPVRSVVDRATGDVVVASEASGDGDAVLRPDTARLVTRTLQGVIEDGTGRRARLGRPAAGKTGTTDDYTNAWFVGYSPQLVASVWVGFAEGAIPMRDIGGIPAVTGGTIPADIWRTVMAAAHESLEPAPFPVVDADPAPTTSTTVRAATTTHPPRRTKTTSPPATTTTAPATTTTTAPATTTTTAGSATGDPADGDEPAV